MLEFRWSRDNRTFLYDAGLALLLAVCSLVPLTVVPDRAFLFAALPWSLLMCAAVALRRVAPLIALAVVVVAGTGMAYFLDTPVPAILAVPVISYSVGRFTRMWTVYLVAIAGIVGSLAGPYSWTRDLPLNYRFLGTSLLVLLCLAIVAFTYLWGRFVRERHLTERLDREIVTERFIAAQRQTEAATELASRKARTEVAQELHDVLAHSLSVIVVQAEGARALTTKRPEAAVEALNVIAETGRKSIGEVRRIVSLMRGEDEAAAFGPSPSLTQIPELVSAAGDRVTLTIDGEVPLVPESLGLATVRVVQEAITNFLKHAGPTATATVKVQYTPQSISVLVRDDGVGSLSKSDGRGSGLPGMRERVQAMGGEFSAGPRAGGGYEVKARLPMPSRLGKSWLRESDR